SAHKMCPIRISDEEATTAPPRIRCKERRPQRFRKNTSMKTKDHPPQNQAQREETPATIPQLRTEENKKVPAGIGRCRPEP
ncbi:hypothetical protein, partial [uncultured Alistipes sp.]|uniref:hypothetical protein n=1 Tax=uncultured Alistipes sp. TaxID=538949 RepID=UPI0026F0421A